jgi:RHS repeat-associated protein
VTALVNSSGVLQALYKYNPYGGLISSSGTLASANTMRFSSKPAIFSSSGAWGFYYYGYRFYDPVNQRWLNRDPLGERGGLNLFVAIGNMPLGRVDTFGMTIFLSDRIQGADREKLLEVMERLARTEVGNCLLQLASDPWMRLAIITNQESPGEPGTAGGGLWSGPPELWDAMVSLEIEDPHYVDAPTRDSLLQHPGIASDQFPIRGSDEISGAAIILGHELGHAILDLNDEDWRTSDYDKENNVAWVENPIRCELGFPRRESYGYSWVAPFAHPHLRIAARY